MPTIQVKTRQGDVPCYINAPDNATAAVIGIHEVWGLNPHTRDVADRIAKLGYAAIAPDLLSHTGITEKMKPEILKRTQDLATRDEAQKELRAAMAPIQSPEFASETAERLQNIYGFMQDSDYDKIAVVGFCFGGTYSWELACAEPKLSAAIVYYGHAPHRDKLANINCPVYGFYGEDDHGLTGHLPELSQTMTEIGKLFEYVIYPGAGHAFFNDTNPLMYREGAAEQSWQQTQAVLKSHLDA